MMAVDALENIEVRLREAIGSGSHEQAAALLQQYRRALETRVRNFPPDDPQLPQLAREALGLLEWGRRTTLAQRANYARQLSTTPDLRPYGPPVRPAHAWNFQV